MSGIAQPVSIGPVVLTGIEVPDAFDRGATMQPIVHRLIGGGRVVQLMGGNPRVRELRGILTGPGAIDRALTLEALRDSGAVVLLVVGAWSERAVVTALDLGYAACGSVIRYRLQAEALPSTAVALAATVSSVIGGAVADLGQAITYATGAAVASLAPALALLGTDQTSLDTATAATPTLDTTSVADALSSTIASSGGTLVSLSNAASPDLVGTSTALSTASLSAQALAGATQAGGYVNRATASIASLGGTSPLPAIHA